MAKFELGDVVEIVRLLDSITSRQLIGMVGIVEEIDPLPNGDFNYSVSGHYMHEEELKIVMERKGWLNLKGNPFPVCLWYSPDEPCKQRIKECKSGPDCPSYRPWISVENYRARVLRIGIAEAAIEAEGKEATGDAIDRWIEENYPEIPNLEAS